MAMTKFNKDMEIISALDDEPNDVGGLTAAQLKAKFDEGGVALKDYLNNTLTREMDANLATKQELNSAVIGVSPDLAAAEAVLAAM